MVLELLALVVMEAVVMALMQVVEMVLLAQPTRVVVVAEVEVGVRPMVVAALAVLA
jgi:hypothetical protein